MAKGKKKGGRSGGSQGRRISAPPGNIEAQLTGFGTGLVREIGGQDVTDLELEKILSKNALKRVQKAQERGELGDRVSLLDLANAGIDRQTDFRKGNFRTALEEQGLLTNKFLASPDAITSRTALGTDILAGEPDPFVAAAQREAEFQDRLDELTNRAFAQIDEQFALAERGTALQEAVLSGDFSNPLVSETLRGFQDQFRGGLAARGVPVTGGNILAEAQGGLAAALNIGAGLQQGGFQGSQAAFGFAGGFNPFEVPQTAINFDTQASAGVRFGQLLDIQNRSASSQIGFARQQANKEFGLRTAQATIALLAGGGGGGLSALL